jgi:hypothetical protein
MWEALAQQRLETRTALRTAETFILVVDYFRIALSASSPNGRFVFGYPSRMFGKKPMITSPVSLTGISYLGV